MAVRRPTGRAQRLTPTTLYDGRRRSLQCRADTGTAAWNSCAGGLPWGQPLDQRADDAWSLTTDWPVAAPTEVLGHVVVRATVTSDQPVAYLSVKLNDVWPDGTSALVTRGLLNLTHRVDPPAPLVPGEPYEVEVEMEATSWVFPAGHSIRLSVAGTDWPNTWVPPRPGHADRRVIADATPGPAARRRGRARVRCGRPRQRPPDLSGLTWSVSHDVLERVTTVRDQVRRHVRRAPRWTDDRPLRGEVDGVRSTIRRALPPAEPCGSTIDWPEASVAVESRLQVRSTADEYFVDIELDAYESDLLIAERRWSRRFPRRLA